MDKYTIDEIQYKNGYRNGYEDGKKDAVKHGRWVHDVANLHMCTNCLESYKSRDVTVFDYCPNCGARMDGTDNEQT